MARRPSPALSLLLAGTLLAGCGIADASIDTRGNKPDPELVQEIVPGVQTKSDVAALLGSPTTTTIFGDESWFYVGGVTRNRVGRIQALDAQEVVAVRFDQRGVVQKIEKVTLADATPVDPVSRVTPTPGNDRNFLQMLFGNIGRFGPGGQAGRTGGPGAPGL
jgi:outer membrane protein assembly factor BamE (lipoprotein component of BamABCDE complex)